MTRWTLLIVIMLGTLNALAADETVYLFSYFTGNGEDGLHLAWSEDGYLWKALKEGKSFLRPEIGGNLMRDPCIVHGPDGLFHMVWTVDWGMKSIGHAESKDLITWSAQQLIPVMEHEPTTKNSWAPELFYDEENQQWLIFWATTIPGRFPDTETQGDDGLNHRIYYVTTQDFETFSDARLFYDQGFNVIDSTIVKVEDKFIMFLKDETLRPPQKNIRVATAEKAVGPYSPASEPITGKYWAEGPSAVKLKEGYTVYFDKYCEHQYGAVQSSDLRTWKDISGKLSFPDGARHGSVFCAPRVLLNTLLIERL